MAKQVAKPKPIVKPAPVYKKFTYESGFFKKYWQQIAVLTALAVGLYIYSVTFDYVLDDQIVMTKNEYVKKGVAGIGDILKTESMQGYFGEQKDLVVGARYRPLSIVTFAIEYQMWGLNPVMSHLMNILLYALTGIFLYRILLMLFPKKDEQNSFFTIPFVASLLFVTHPIHSEVVANVKGRDEIMTLLGALGSVYYTLKYLSNRKSLYLVLSGIMFFLGLMSKENAITFLAVIPATVYFFTNTEGSVNFKTVVPLLIATVVYLLIRYSVIGYFLSSGQKVTDLMNNPFAQMTGSEKMATIFYTLLMYLKLLIFPHPLTHDYYPYAIPKLNWSSIWAILSLLIHIGLAVFAIKNFKKKSLLSYCVIFYLATLSIVSNIVFPVGTFMNERFVYISSIAMCLAGAWLFVNYIPAIHNGRLKSLGLALTALFALGFSAKTIARVPAWKNKLSLNVAAIKYSGNSARANCFMGTALFEEYQVEKDEAKRKAMLADINKYIDRSLEIYPDYYSALQMYSGVVGANYAQDGNLDKALDAFYKILSRRTTITYVDQFLDYLGNSPTVDQKKMQDFYFKLGYDLFYKQKKYYNNAAKYLDKALKYNDLDPKANFAMSLVMSDIGDYEKADQFKRVALTSDPGIITFFEQDIMRK